MKFKILILSVMPLILSACASMTETPPEPEQTDFFTTLGDACGQVYTGYMSYPEDPEHDFAGQLLVAHIRTCRERTILVPFTVGEDKSRTWVFRKQAEGIQLKHSHRSHERRDRFGIDDESVTDEDEYTDYDLDVELEQEISNYGGLALDLSDANSLSFPADKYTAQIIPAAATNVWTVSLSDDQSELTYYLERNDAPRFKAVLKVAGAYPENPQHGQVHTRGDIHAAWDSNEEKWVTLGTFWTNYALENGGLEWGYSEEYPVYEDVLEHDKLMIAIPEEGFCLMEFYHGRWRRANDVWRWDDEFNEYLGCPYVFD